MALRKASTAGTDGESSASSWLYNARPLEHRAGHQFGIVFVSAIHGERILRWSGFDLRLARIGRLLSGWPTTARASGRLIRGRGRAHVHGRNPVHGRPADCGLNHLPVALADHDDEVGGESLLHRSEPSPFIQGLFTSTRARRLASGSSAFTPAEGSTITSTVFACRTSAGKTAFFLSSANAQAKRRAGRSRGLSAMPHEEPPLFLLWRSVYSSKRMSFSRPAIAATAAVPENRWRLKQIAAAQTRDAS